MSKQLVRRQTSEIAAGTAEGQQYLTFTLGQEMFAVGILHIREIIEYGSVTTVPLMPAFVRGVINLRGSVVPVIDLAARFGRPLCAITRRSCIVIVELESGGERQELGVLVDAVSEVLEIPAAEIEPAPAFGAKIRTDFIAAMGKVMDRFVILLNMNKVLAVEEIAMLAQLNETEAQRPLEHGT
jgi:purine-binding chemotaxis protein CheW